MREERGGRAGRPRREAGGLREENQAWGRGRVSQFENNDLSFNELLFLTNLDTDSHPGKC